MPIVNTVRLIGEILNLIDRDGNARFSDEKIIKSINTAVDRIVEDRLDNIKVKKNYSFESVQTVRDQLYTLIPPTLAIVPIVNVVAYPLDYNYFLKMTCVIDGEIVVARLRTYNEQGVMYDNPFSLPTDEKPYFDQNLSGFNLFRDSQNTGAFTMANLDYVKNPDVVSIGNEFDKITSTGTLVNGTTYIVYEQAVQNGVTYAEGSTFVAVGAILTSGIVIPNALIVNCNLPFKLQYEIISLAASIMQKSISAFNEGAVLDRDS